MPSRWQIHSLWTNPTSNSNSNSHSHSHSPKSSDSNNNKSKRRPTKTLTSSEDSDLWLNDYESSFLNPQQLFFTMQLPNSNSNSKSKSLTLAPNSNSDSDSDSDLTLLLPDDTLLRILSKLPNSQRLSNSVVCKRWLHLQGRLFRSLKLLDWSFLLSGRLLLRFPNLTHLDLSPASLLPPTHDSSAASASPILLHPSPRISMHLSPSFSPLSSLLDDNSLPVHLVDKGLASVAAGYPNLCKLVVVGASQLGLLSISQECSTLQELELHKCADNVLSGIAGCRNLQILKLVASVDGLYSDPVSDIGLTILAQGCNRLVKLELTGCAGSFDGIKAIGQCCQMLEELTLADHRMDGGWLAGLSYCENLKTLKLQSCQAIDSNPGPDEYLGSCPALERLHLHKCQLRDKRSLGAMFMVCQGVKDVLLQDCWGLEDDIFSSAICCRRVRFLSLEGCSVLTTKGLESVIISWKDLQSLWVTSCKNIKDSEISPELATLFSVLKDLKWRPDTKSLLAASLAGTGMGRKGGRFFKRA